MFFNILNFNWRIFLEFKHFKVLCFKLSHLILFFVEIYGCRTVIIYFWMNHIFLKIKRRNRNDVSTIAWVKIHLCHNHEISLLNTNELSFFLINYILIINPKEILGIILLVVNIWLIRDSAINLSKVVYLLG